MEITGVIHRNCYCK